MIRIDSQKELLESFRLLDRDAVQLPENLKFPIVLRDYLAWLEPSGNRAYLVFTEPGRKNALGIVFRRDQSTVGPAPRMCEWCHSVGSSDEIGLLTATSSSNRRVGMDLCRDLSCKEKVRSVPGINSIPQSLSPEEQSRRIVERMTLFARRNLF